MTGSIEYEAESSSNGHRAGPRLDTPSRGALGARHNAILRLGIEIDHAHNDNGYEFSVLMVRFDGLGRLAGRLGYAVGPDLLRNVSRVLTGDLGARDLCCRLGGDDYLVILPGQGAAESLDLEERLGRSWSPGGGARADGIAISTGSVSSRGQASTIAGLFAAVDEALQVAKAKGIRDTRGFAIVASAAKSLGRLPIGFVAGRLRAAEDFVKGAMIDLLRVARMVLHFAVSVR